MIREILKDAESVRSGLSHVPNQPALLPPYRGPGGMQSRPVGMPSRIEKQPDIWDTHGISGKVFVDPPASSSSPHPGGFNPWFPNVTEHISPHVIRSIYPKRFLQIHRRLLRHLFQEDSIPNVTEDTPVLTSAGRPVTCVNVTFQTQS